VVLSLRLETKRISSPDVEVDIWEPESRDDVYVLLEVEIGVAGEDGADIFQLMIATPEGLRRHAGGEVIAERALVVVSDFSWAQVRKTLGAIVDRCAANDWSESVLRLQRYFSWEYEDYVQAKER
jgi:hypothetical protein